MMDRKDKRKRTEIIQIDYTVCDIVLVDKDGRPYKPRLHTAMALDGSIDSGVTAEDTVFRVSTDGKGENDEGCDS